MTNIKESKKNTLILTPLLYVAHYWIDRFLGKQLSEEMTIEASRDTSFI